MSLPEYKANKTFKPQGADFGTVLKAKQDSSKYVKGTHKKKITLYEQQSKLELFK